MRMAREWMSRSYLAITGQGSGTVSGKRRDAYARPFYVACVILWLGFSIASWIFAPPWLLLFVLAVLWGVFFGVTFLYLMPGKMLATVFGIILGMTGSSLTAAPGAISKTNEQVKSAFVAIVGSENQFSPTAIWLFVFIVAVLCLPAFFEKGVVHLD